MMNKHNFLIIFFLIAGLLPISAQAAEFNGSKPFISAITDAYECGENIECCQVVLQDIDCPRFLKVDVSKKLVTGTMEDQSTREVEIQSKSHVDGNLILQGVQKGRAWSMVISEKTGKMTLSISGQGEGFIFFGDSFLK